MFKGGYQIIDISGHVFREGESKNFDGIYETITKATKPIMLSEFKCIVGSEIDYARASFVTLTTNGMDEYHTIVSGKIKNYIVSIKENDDVVITFDLM